VLVVHLLVAQVTLILAVGALVTGRVSRWRPAWLGVPAAAGLVWAAAIGLGQATAGFAAGPRQVTAYLLGTVGHPGRLLHMPAAFSGAAHWLPRQIPLALLAAAAEAAVLMWLGRAGWPGRAARPDPARQASPARQAGLHDWPGYRPGLIVAARRRLTAARLAAGEVVTADGCALGIDTASGRAAEVSWADAGHGVLVAGADPDAAARVSFPVACAAVRRRKSLIAIDLTGSTWLAQSLTAACERAGAPLRRFGAGGPGCYEPFRSHPPRLAASLAARLVDWAGSTDRQRRAAERYLAGAFAVLAACPPHSRPQDAVLDRLIALLDPAALRTALAGLPATLPHHDALALRVTEAAGALAAEPGASSALRGQLRQLRSGTLGRWLRAPEAAEPVSVGQAARDRGVVLFTLDGPREQAAMVARLAVADLTAVLAGLRDLGLRGDGVAWIHGCESLTRPALAGLLALGPVTGTAVVLSTASAAAAASLAGAARLVVTGGPADQELAARLAGQAPFRNEDGPQGAAAELLRWQDEDEFAIIGRGPRPWLRPACRSVPIAWARPAAPSGPVAR
jgi:hypothetical protein